MFAPCFTRWTPFFPLPLLLRLRPDTDSPLSRSYATGAPRPCSPKNSGDKCSLIERAVTGAVSIASRLP